MIIINHYFYFVLKVNTRNNVSNRIGTDTIKFRKTSELRLRTGHYSTANLRKTDGFVNFFYHPPANISSTFYILPCGGGIVRAKLSAPGILRVINHVPIIINIYLQVKKNKKPIFILFLF